MQGNMPKKELETFRCDHRKLQSLSLDIQETIAVTVEPNDLACRYAEQNDEYESEAQRWSAICLSNYDVGKRRQRRSEPHRKGPKHGAFGDIHQYQEAWFQPPSLASMIIHRDPYLPVYVFI
jgi:hypothetical protein